MPKIKKIYQCLFIISVIICILPISVKADNIDNLLKRFQEQSKQNKQLLNRNHLQQKMNGRMTEHILLQNQRKIEAANVRIKDQNRQQRAKLVDLKQRMDDLKRQQSYYTRVKKTNPLKNHFYNIRNSYK